MASFPRTLLPIEVTSLEMPGPLISKAQSGKVFLRTTQQVGRTWTERYLVNVRSVDGRALLAAVSDYWRNGTIFTIDHRDHVTPLGTGGGSPLVNSATQLVTDPENFGAWTVLGTVGRTSGQADPLGGSTAYLLDSNTPTAGDGIFQAVTYTGNAVKAFASAFKAGTSTLTRFGLLANGATWRHRANITWTGGVPSLTTANGSGVLYNVEPLAVAGWYRIAIAADGVLAADANRLDIYPDGSGGGGTVYVHGCNSWNEVSPARYAGPSQVAGTTGAELYVNGGTASVSNWLRAGDVLAIGGVSAIREATANVNTQANGYAIVPVNPPLFTGGSPADNAVVTITGVTMNACILEPPTFPTTSGSSNDYGELICRFSESLN